MAKLPTTIKILKEVFSKEEQKWIDLLLEPLNRFMENVSNALNRQLTFKENIAADIKTIVFDGAPQEVKWSLKARPIGAWIIQCREISENHVTLAAPIYLDWEFTGDGMVLINDVVGLTASSAAKFNVTILLITG